MTNQQPSVKVGERVMPKVKGGGRTSVRRKGKERARVQKMKKTRRKRRFALAPRFPLGGFATSQGATLRYVDEIELTASITTPDVETYRINSIYDPYFAGGGHQPMGTDELFAIYKNATVVGAKMTVTYLPKTPVSSTPCAIILYKSPNPASLSAASLSPMLEQANATEYMFAGVPDSTGSNAPKPLTIYYSPRLDQDITDPMDENGLRNTVTSNPGKPYYADIYAASIGGTAPGTVNLLVEIEFKVVFSERVAQSSS